MIRINLSKLMTFALALDVGRIILAGICGMQVSVLILTVKLSLIMLVTEMTLYGGKRHVTENVAS